jgi:hypothetical protein
LNVIFSDDTPSPFSVIIVSKHFPILYALTPSSELRSITQSKQLNVFGTDNKPVQLVHPYTHKMARDHAEKSKSQLLAHGSDNYVAKNVRS